MKKPIVRIGVFMVLIIVLPTLFFSAYEIGNLSQNEQMIDSIYVSQLESVMFSINQYSDDVVSGWAWDIEYAINKPDDERDLKIKEFNRFNAAIGSVFLADSSGIISIYNKPGDYDTVEARRLIDQTLRDNKKTLDKLQQYIENGYRRIESLPIDIPGKHLFVFALASHNREVKTGGLMIDVNRFVSENLGPKIQNVGQDKLFIAVFESAEGKQVYSTELLSQDDLNIEHKKALWLLPAFEIGIQLKGETVEDLVKTRTYYNVFLILIMDIVLITGAWFVYRNVRQEVKLAQIKSEFVSNVSHEIRTPLAVINMYSETLEMDRIKSEEKKKEYYKVIHAEATRLSGMVNKILNFSKIESGKRNYSFEPTDVNEVLRDVLDTYKTHIENKGFTYSFSPEDELPLISADREAIAEAIINLLDNAIKYSDDKKQIEVSTGFRKGMVGITIRDHGIGIDDKDKKLIFDKFYRVTKGDLAHKAKGSGIGLNIVKHIMDAHQGTISLVSHPGEGSQFTLNFRVIKT